MKMIDTHAHIYDEAFRDDLTQVLQRAKEAGVNKCIMPGIDRSYHQSMMDFASAHPDFAHPAIGLHPTSVNQTWREELDFVKEEIKKARFYGIGEIGLDCHWSTEFLEEQKTVFAEQLLLADEYSLPVIIHSRDATNEIFEVLDSVKGKIRKPIKGVFHAFSGSLETYRRIEKSGDFYIGIGGVVTYKNASIANVIKDIPIERIITETDCPWLTPVPFRGTRNEISYICIVAEKIAELKGMNPDDVKRITEKNAEALFGLEENRQA